MSQISPFPLRTKVITITRDLTAITGSVAYTGVGFQPKILIATGGINANAAYNNFCGMTSSGGTTGSTSTVTAGAVTLVQTNFITCFDTGGTLAQTATVSSYDADGFTLSWTKTSTPTGTATFFIACIG